MTPASERFSERARTALAAAEEEARALDHNYVGQEHLVLGLVRDAEATATKVLTALGATPEKVRAAVLHIVGKGPAPAPPELPYTPRAKKALDLAFDEARRLNHSLVGTEHLLLGILREGQGLGANVLAGSFNVTLDAARAEVQRQIAGGPEREPWLRRYQLVLPNDLFEAVQRLAERQDTTMLEVLRRFIRLGLLVTELQQTPGTALIVRDKDGERQLVLL